MAIINSIRKRSSLLVGVVTCVLIFFFIGGDLFRLNSVFSSRSRSEVGVIAGETVMLREYQAQIAQMQQAMPNSTNEEIQEKAWEALILQKGLDKAVAALGLTVSKEELVDMVQGNNIHPAVKASFKGEKGEEFDKKKLINYLQQLSQKSPQEREHWSNFERSLVEHRTKEKFFQLLEQSSFKSNLEEKPSWKNHKLDVKYLYIPYYSYSKDDITITQEMLKGYLKEHKNAYQVDESRTIEYVSFPVIPTEKDRELLKKEVDKLKTAFQRAKHVRSFAESNTDLPATNAHLQCTERQLPAELVKHKMSLQKGKVAGPFKSDSGYKLYRKISVPAAKKQYYDIAVIEKQFLPGDEAHDQAFQKADACANAVNGVVELATYADKHKLNAQEATVGIHDTRVGNFAQARELARWLYNDTKIGDLSPVFELEGNYVVAVMTDRTPAGTAPIERVQNEITANLENIERGKIITKKLKSLSGSTLEAKAKQWGASAKLLACKGLRFSDDTLEQAGMARKAIGAAFALHPGKQTIVADDNGVILIEVVKKTPDNSADKELIDNQELMKYFRKYQEQITAEKSLKDLAKVQDNRHRFY